MAAGDFTIPDASAQTPTDLNTLFGVNQNVGGTPVLLKNAQQPDDQLRKVLQQHGEPTTLEPAQSTTLTGALQGFYGMTPDALTDLQKQLYSGGFFPASYYGKTPKMPQFGSADDDSYAAFKSAVVQAARSGRALPDVLDAAAQSVAAGGGVGSLSGGSDRQPLVVRLSNPADIRAVVEDTATKLLGRKVDDGTINQLVAGFQGLQSGEQTGAYNAAAGQGGTVTQAPDATAYAAQQLRAANPAEASAHDAVGLYGDFLKLWANAGGGQ